jgi:hypothetical protein
MGTGRGRERDEERREEAAHDEHPSHQPRTILHLLRTFLCLALALFLFGCSSSSKSADRRNSGSGESVAVPAGARPQQSARDALQKLLAAEKALDYNASFQYVQHGADQPYPTVATWTKYREDLPRITGFSVSATGGDQVVATVEHQPGIDSFVGLSPARERQTWGRCRRAAVGCCSRTPTPSRSSRPTPARPPRPRRGTLP